VAQKKTPAPRRAGTGTKLVGRARAEKFAREAVEALRGDPEGLALMLSVARLLSRRSRARRR